MVNYLPQTIDELIKISGFGKAKAEKYGERFLNIIVTYCTAHNLSSRIHEKTPKRQRKEKGSPKADTKFESLKLYKEGKSVAEIAGTRNLAVSTIETHLAHYVKSGDIKINELVSREKLVLIEPVLKIFDGVSITPIKEKLGNDISYGEIKLVMAWKEFQEQQAGNSE
jgi:ATP-dependent DNA helicase RecQ